MNLRGRNLIDISDLSNEELLFLLEQAKILKQNWGPDLKGIAVTEDSGVMVPSHSELPGGKLSGKSVALIFFEPSTRTRTSFQMAAYRLGARTLKLESSMSSAQKGETIFDTARNIEAMSPDLMIIRHAGSGVPQQIARLIKIPVINAGDGFHAHPTQALLDAFTMLEHFSSLKGKKVLIIGDISHSRVARSNMQCLKRLGAEVTICGPPTLIPPVPESWGVQVTDRLDDVLPQADVVMALRMQSERQASFQVPSLKEYTVRYGITEDRLTRIGGNSLILHPGPVNRGIEFASAVLRDPRSRVMEQVRNGVVIRACLMSLILG